ncbi:MAG: hypothetical protein PQJ46_01020 [Spirochaetales bacterium]|nr:hypothetical protein [Spirochaetales bacterium]
MKRFIHNFHKIILLLICTSILITTGCENGSDDSGSTTSDTAYNQEGGTASLSNESYSSSVSDENALKVSDGGSCTITGTSISKSGDTEDRENSGFYGFNSGVLASSSSSDTSYVSTGESTTISLSDGCTVTTDASGANGVFAFGEDAVITCDDITITTTGSDNSRGVDATYGGTVTITNSTISTTGASCAALATDRYGDADAPKINATNVSGTTSGTGSPGIYCTGTFNVENCTLSATGSEAVAIEGLNSVTLKSSSISGADKWGVIIYQSMSGDSSEGTGTFSMTEGSLTNTDTSGPLFFICDTDAIISMTDVTVKNSSSLLLVAGKASSAYEVLGSDVNTDWGTNGGTVTFTADTQTLSGKIIICDSSSSIDLTLQNSSTLTSVINTDNIDNATVKLTIDSSSSWSATGVSYLSELSDSDTSYSNIDSSYNIYVNGATTASYTSSTTLSSGGILYIK